jgi:hypothetical protein
MRYVTKVLLPTLVSMFSLAIWVGRGWCGVIDLFAKKNRRIEMNYKIVYNFVL